MGRIGSPAEYEVWLLDGPTEVPLTRLPWGDLNWQRIRSGVSAASATVPGKYGGIQCCGDALQAWGVLLAIYRDGSRVWDGPVTGWSFGSAGLTISAFDRSVILTRRLVAVDRDFAAVDLWTMVRTLLSDASVDVEGAGDTPWGFSYSPMSATSGLTLTRSFRVARLESLDRVLADLTEQAGLSWSQRNGSFFLDPRVFWSDGDATYRDPLLTPRSVVDGQLNVNVDAAQLATGVYVGSEGEGIVGFPNVITNTNTTYSSYSLLAAITAPRVAADTVGGFVTAAQMAAARLAAPTVTLEQIRLSPAFGSPTFPSDLSTLMPGVVCPVDFPDQCGLDIPIITVDPFDYEVIASSSSVRHARLDQLDVRASLSDDGLDESVLGSFTAVAV